MENETVNLKYQKRKEHNVKFSLSSEDFNSFKIL